ncbi:MAG: ABC transporter permease [Ruminococcus sp.]|nr:ABC transporter permease [Ruminococcus sp.]
MFIHNFKYTLKTLFKDKMLIFWTFLFPVIMSVFFNMAFSNIEANERLDIINLVVVRNDYYHLNKSFIKVIEKLSDVDDENRLFNTLYITEDITKPMLEKDEIDGYIVFNENTPTIVTKKEGIKATIIKYVTEEIIQNEDMISNIINSKMDVSFNNIDLDNFYNNVYSEILSLKENSTSNIKDISVNNLSYTMIEYYTLMAMTCLYGGILGVTAINSKLANMSEKGKRVSIAPTPKGNLILSSLGASFIVQLIGVTILFLFMLFILKIDFGNNLPLIILNVLVGSLAGLTLGLAVASLIKKNEGIKVGIIIALTMLGSFFTGMMGPQIKYMIDKSMPLINKINPASMITDAFYSLYYYDTLDRFYFNILSLLVFSGVMIILSLISLRRQKYDSI